MTFRETRPIVGWVALAFTGICSAWGATDSPSDQPNVILIMADDLGIGELGCYGQSLIRTPRLDGLAAGGIQFDQFYSAFPVCAPARCSLLTGRHAGRSEIRANGNPQGRQLLPQEGRFPGQNPISDETVTLAELLREEGYATAAFGKWGLGYEGSSGDPLNQGFDHFFGFLCQIHAHNHYPRFLWDDGRKLKLEGNDRQLQGRQYSQDLLIERAQDFIREKADRPFFLYLPFAVPHLSLQVPVDDPGLSAYRIANAERDSVNYRGVIPEAEHEGGSFYLKHPTPRAAYAAMVSRMDRGIGEVLDLLVDLEIDERTIVLFTSDNGPTFNRLGGSDSTYFGSALGRRGRKGSVYEGGIRVPLIVNWPQTIAPGQESNLASYFPDLLPTILDLVGANEAIPEDCDGLSFKPTLLGDPDRQEEHEYLYWEFLSYGGQQAIRVGNWKAVRQKLRQGLIRTELYNLKVDPTESINLAEDRPDLIAQLEALMDQLHVPTDRFPLPGIDVPSR